MILYLVIFCTATLVFLFAYFLKRWELQNNRVVLEVFRKRADHLTETWIARVQHVALGLWNMITTRKGFMLFVHKLAVLGLYVVRFTERRLLKLTTLIRGKYGPKQGGEASKFLKTVGHHKDHLRELRNENSHS